MEKQIYFIFVTEKVTLANVAQSCRQVGSLTPNLRVRQHSTPRDSALGGSVCSCKPAVKRTRTHVVSVDRPDPGEQRADWLSQSQFFYKVTNQI